MPDATRSLRYMPALDGLRAVAVGLVIVAHTVPGGHASGVGVDVFFVISGFLITTILLREIDDFGGIRLGRFYLRRAFRLYPPLIVTVAASFALALLAGIPLIKATGSSVISLAYLANVFMTLSGMSLGLLSHTWSLAMEEQFYLVWPAALLVMGRVGLSGRTMIAVTSVASAASLSGWVVWGDRFDYNPLLKAGGLLVGCVAGLAVHRYGLPQRTVLPAAAGSVLIVCAIVLEAGGTLERNWTLPMVTLGVVPVVMHLAYGTGRSVDVVGSRPLAYLGAISYELYLWHFPLVVFLAEIASWGPAVRAAVVVSLSLLLADVTHRFVSQPLLARRDQVMGASTARRRATSAPVTSATGAGG